MNDKPHRILALIGARSMLAQKVRQLAPAGYEVHGLGRPDLDLAEPCSVRAALEVLRPSVIVNCAAYTDVDGCESHADLAFRVNGEGPGVLAAAARDLEATLVHASTDYVFAGDGSVPYREEDPTAPRSVYGRSKLAGEEAIVGSGLERSFIVRTSWLFGPGGGNFVETMVRLAREREELRVVADQVGSPTYTGDLARAIFNLLALEDAEAQGGQVPYGFYHFANDGICSWHGFAEAIVALARESGEPVKVERVVPVTTADFPRPAPRPAYSVLDTNKFRRTTSKEIPPWQDALQRYFAERGK